MCGGCIIEDISDYARVHELFHSLGSEAKRRNDSIMGFNTNSSKVLYNLDKRNPLSRIPYDYIGIYEHKTVMFKPLSGLCTVDKYLPLRYMGGLTLEFELITDPKECLMSDPFLFAADDLDIPPAAAIDVQKDINIFTAWHISQFAIKADIVTLDNNFNDEYVRYLLSGKALAINYTTYISQMQTVSGQDNAVNITRSVSRLKSIFISHVGPINTPESYVHKEFNTFFHPMAMAAHTTGLDLYDYGQEFEWQVQIGSRLYPEYCYRTISESYYQLFNCLGIFNSNFHSIDIHGKEYRHVKFIIGLDLEKVLGSSFTGINTKASDLITIQTKSLTHTNNATKMHVILHADCVQNLRDSGVEVYE